MHTKQNKAERKFHYQNLKCFFVLANCPLLLSENKYSFYRKRKIESNTHVGNKEVKQI